ncbi:hypothetical protein HaLaN_07066 [Haematococcus lacustris]|uniref:Uncharacterized protein n=1 Tax=Haematococcus lacustris TaxID=44745 RepID=A0A699Z7Q0_HAELA|nr:hypothetical protein HaLaN_07066 [Haematococcus lacustris]
MAVCYRGVQAGGRGGEDVLNVSVCQAPAAKQLGPLLATPDPLPHTQCLQHSEQGGGHVGIGPWRASSVASLMTANPTSTARSIQPTGHHWAPRQN